MGDLFDAKYYQRSIDSFQFLLREYPTGKYREDALLAVAHIEQDDLHDSVLAQKAYQQFLTLHPRSPHAAEVRASIDKLNAPSAAPRPSLSISAARDQADRATSKTISAEKTPPATDTKPGSPEAYAGDSSGPQVSRIRTWNADTYSRIVIDVGAKVKYQAARIAGPDRIYFDIEGAKLNSSLLRNPIDVEGGFLKTVRVAQYQSGVVRVVLEVNRVTDYSVFLLPDPYRLVVDVYGTSAAAEAAARSTAPAPGPTTTTDVPPAKPEKAAKETVASAAPNSSPGATGKHVTKSPFAPPDNGQSMQSQAQPAPAQAASTSSKNNDVASATKKLSDKTGKNSQKSVTAATTTAKPTQGSESDGSTMSAAATPTDTDDSPLPVRPASAKKSGRATKSAHDQAEEMGPPPRRN